MNILLGPGDGVTGNELDLNSAAGTYATLTFDAPPGAPSVRQRTVSLMLNISAASQTAVIEAVRALELMLNRAATGRQPGGQTAGLVLSVRVDDTSEWVYFDVLSGQLGYPSSGVELLYGMQVDLPLQLTCLPYARGDAITDSAVSVTGDAPVFTRASIPGDVPALVQYTITDESTSSQFLNRIRIAHRSQADLDAGDFDGYYNGSAISPATSGADTSAYNDDIVTLASGNVTPGTWQSIADMLTPTPLADNAGLYDIWVRVDDATVATLPPKGLAVNTVSGGSMPIGSYQMCVTAILGANETSASDIKNVTVLNATLDRLTCSWNAPPGTVTNYRVYWKRGTNAWIYKAVGSGTTSLNIDNESGATTADPPTTPAVNSAQFRALVSLESGTTTLELPPVNTQIANGASEWVYLGTTHVPPIAVQEGGTSLQGRVAVQTKAVTAVNIQVDAIVLMPADEQQVVASYGYLREPTGLTLAALRKWVIGTDRHGRDYGRLLNTGDDTDEGQVAVVGPSVAGPGDTTLVVIPEVVGGVSNVADVALDVVLRITPRYRYLRGTV